MFEFRWKLPDKEAPEVVLRVYARHGWIGRKILTVGDRTIYNRGWFAGIESRFAHPMTGDMLHLRYVRVDGTARWRAALFRNDQEIPEATGEEPPMGAARPRSIAVMVGLTYLVMLMSVIMLPSIVSILDALKLQHADRKFVLTVVDPTAPESELSAGAQDMPLATEGQAWTGQLHASGGVPPYTWELVREQWPVGMKLDSATGEVTFTPKNRYDHIAAFTVKDSKDHQAAGMFALVVRAEHPILGWPKFETARLPVAVDEQPYELQLEATGGKPPYVWEKRTGELPKGLKLGSTNGLISGTVEPDELAELDAAYESQLTAGPLSDTLRSQLAEQEVKFSDRAYVSLAGEGGGWTITDDSQRYLVRKSEDKLLIAATNGQFPLTLRVIDSAYRAKEDIYPWIVPFVITAICLLGYWNMRRWGVLLHAPLIVVQAVLAILGGAPISGVAVVLQFLMWLVGAAHLKDMY